MVDAGIARKVDFGEGRFRFEQSYRHPRHFHLICKTCNRSFEFLSSDIEALIEEIAAARGFTPRQSVVQIYGTCEDCRTGRSRGRRRHGAPSCCSRATRCASRSPPSAAASSSTPAPRASPATRAAARCSRSWPRKRRSTSARSRRATASCCEQDPQLESRPTFLFFKGAANGLFAAGAEQLRKGVDDQQALLIGIRCERGSHRFFKRYGERFEDSEGKQIFLEFADEERAHLELLIREYRRSVERQRQAPRDEARASRGRRRPPDP